MFKELFVEQYNLFPGKNNPIKYKAKESASNVLNDVLIRKFGKIFSVKSTGLTPNGKSYQIDFKKGKENQRDEVIDFISKDETFNKMLYVKNEQTFASKSSEFKLILDNRDVISYYDNGKDWMRAYGDEKPLQAFDSKMWNKEKIIKQESKHYKIKKIVD